MNTAAFLLQHATNPTWVTHVHDVMHVISVIVGVVGVGVLVWGLLVAGALLLRAEARRLAGRDPGPAHLALRHVLGAYLLLGLEFLIAADIIETIIAPNLEALAALGAIVVIRTVISVSINWELRHASRGEETT